MSSRLALIQGLTPTSTGNADYTSADMNGKTPKAAMIIVSKVDDGSLTRNNAAVCIGVTDGTTHNSFHYHDVDNVGTTATYAGCETDLIKIKNDNGVGFDIEAAFGSFITNGIRLNFTTVDVTQFYLHVYLFGDDGASECSAYVGNFDVPTNATPVDINTVGFEADLVLFFSCAKAVGVSGTFAQTVSGVCANISGTPQGGLYHFSNNGQATSDIEARINSNYVQDRSVSTDWKIQVSNFDANGFDITRTGSNATSGLNVTYLALKFTDRNVWCGQYAIPTSTGNDSKTGIGFKPAIVGAFLSMSDAIDTDETGVLAEGVAYGVFTDSIISSIGESSRDAQATTNTRSSYNPGSILVRAGSGATSWEATFVSMDSDGHTLNFTTAPGSTRYVYEWAIGEAPQRTPDLMPFIMGMQ